MADEQHNDIYDRRVIVSGPRTLFDEDFVFQVLDDVDRETDDMGLNLVLVHDGSPGTAELTERWAESEGVDTIPYDDIADYREANEAMVSKGADMCLIFNGFNALAAKNCAILAKAADIYVRHVEGTQSNVG